MLLVIPGDTTWGGVTVFRRGHYRYLMHMGWLSGRQVEVLSEAGVERDVNIFPWAPSSRVLTLRVGRNGRYPAGRAIRPVSLGRTELIFILRVSGILGCFIQIEVVFYLLHSK